MWVTIRRASMGRLLAEFRKFPSLAASLRSGLFSVGSRRAPSFEWISPPYGKKSSAQCLLSLPRDSRHFSHADVARSHVHAAVNTQDLPCDVSGVFTCKKAHR